MPRSRPSARAAVLLCLVLLAGCSPDQTVPPPSGAAVPPSAGPSAETSAAPSDEASPEPSDAIAPPVRWADCGEGFLCARLPVPKDYADPSKGTLSVSMIRLPATDPKDRVGSLIINPGGPGGSGVDFVREGAAQFPTALRKRFDLVGFDPRGVNSSSAVRCIDNLDGHASLDPSPDTPAELTALADDAKAYATACGERNADLLPYLSTDAVARDLDLIRQSVGDKQLNYLGFSYGTLIGSRYAERFPDRIRAMVLDGAIDPSLDLEHFREGQAVGFETALHHFLADCAKRRSCAFHGGGKPAAAFDHLMAAIDQHPLPTPETHDRRSVGPGLAASAVLGAMYSQAAWRGLAVALTVAEHGDGSLLLQISDPFRGRKPNGSYSNQQDAYVSNTCLDYPAPTDVATFTRWADAVQADAPHFARQVAYNDLVCAFWPVPAPGRPHRVSAPGAPPIVIVGSSADPATPYAWAKSLAGELAGSRLITREGEGHTGYLASGCVARAVDAYLADLELPKRGLTCF